MDNAMASDEIDIILRSLLLCTTLNKGDWCDKTRLDGVDRPLHIVELLGDEIKGGDHTEHQARLVQHKAYPDVGPHSHPQTETEERIIASVLNE